MSDVYDIIIDIVYQSIFVTKLLNTIDNLMVIVVPHASESMRCSAVIEFLGVSPHLSYKISSKICFCFNMNYKSFHV